MSDYALGSILDFKFPSTYNSVPTTLSGSPEVTVFRGGDTPGSTASATLSVDAFGITGLNHVQIDTSSGFFVAGKCYQIVLTAGTVGGVSVVSFVIDDFTLSFGNIATYTGNTVQTGDSFMRIGATGSGLTSLASASSMATVSTRTLLALPAIAPGATNGLLIAGTNAAATFSGSGLVLSAMSIGGISNLAQTGNSYPGVLKIQAATYDSAALSGSTLTLSNAATMVVSTIGRVTT